jgi:KUP system potassium uptake protein
VGERQPLVRLPTCAVFHKIARGQGAPHTFIGMFGSSHRRQSLIVLIWQVSCANGLRFPVLSYVAHLHQCYVQELTRTQIFLNVSVVPIARVSAEDRYAITKVRTVEGILLNIHARPGLIRPRVLWGHRVFGIPGKVRHPSESTLAPFPRRS